MFHPGVIARSGLRILTPPAGLGWTLPFDIVTDEADYFADVNFDAQMPAYVWTYYVSPTGSAVASPSDNDPSTPITLARFKALADTKLLCRAFMENSVHYVASLHSIPLEGAIYRPWVGQGSKDMPTLVIRSTGAVPSWTADTGTTYYCTHSVANTEVWDLITRDANNIPQRLTGAANLAACRSTAGSFFYDSGTSRMYVTTTGGRDLTAGGGDTDIIVHTGGTLASLTRVGKTTWMDSIRMIGTAGSGTSGTLWNRDCQWLGSEGNGHASTDGTVYSFRPRCGGSRLDGMNYHSTVLFYEEDLRSIRNGYSGGGANNCSTSHETCIGVSVGGDYAGSEDRTIHDIQSSKRWMVGSTVRASVGTGATAATVVSGVADGDATKIWLDEGCTVEDTTVANNTTAKGLYCYSGSQINYANPADYFLRVGGTLSGIAPYNFTPAGTPTVSVHSSSFSTSDLSQYTFAIGGSGTLSGQYIIAFNMRNNASVPTSLSIGGFSGASYTKLLHRAGVTDDVVVYGVRVPSGTTGNIVLTLGAGVQRCSYVMWDANSLVNILPNSLASATTDNPSMSIVTPANSARIGYAAANSTTNGITWTGFATPAAGRTVETTLQDSWAHENDASGGTDNCGGDWTGTFTSGAQVAMSFNGA